ncbi:MAG: class II aldolase/adducin family protein [Actinomycetota bacterium]|nr:class II aldolase/adducin family protein [Actinomycetota bacterium]
MSVATAGIGQSLVTQACIGARALSEGGHDDFNQGQVSCRVPGAAEFAIKNAMVGFDEVTPAEFVEAQVDATARPHRLAPPELPLHQAIYAARPDVGGIVHSHAPDGLVFGALDEPIVALSHEGALLSGQVSHFTDTSNTVLTIEVADRIAESLGDGVGVFLVNHGSVVVGKSVRHAVVHALMLERACRLQLTALSTRLPFSVSSSSDVDAKRDYIFADLSVKSYWSHLRRSVSRRSPEVETWTP